MKLAARICLLVLFCGFVAFESAAQRRLPNGTAINRPPANLSAPVIAVKQESRQTTPPAPASPANSPAQTKAAEDPRIKVEFDGQNSMEGKIEFKTEIKPPFRPPPPPAPPPCKASTDAHDWLQRADRAATVLREFLDASDRSMPISMLNRSNCVAVVPSMKKGGFSVGGQWGRGVVSCRYDNRAWSPPVFFTVTGGSFGLQIGFQLTDLVMIISDRSGVDSLLQGKLEIGASAGGTALLMGRNAGFSSDVLMDSRIFSYARSRGLFVGLELRGAYIRPDATAHSIIYGETVHVHDILSSEKIASEAKAACYASVNAFPRALRDISPAKLYYAKVPRARYQQASPPSAPAR